jgi:hypothetical protein
MFNPAQFVLRIICILDHYQYACIHSSSPPMPTDVHIPVTP